MPHIQDPQMARLFERLDHLVASMDEIKPILTTVNTLQNNQDHMARNIDQLMTNAEVRSTVIHQLDKRVLVVERWHKASVGFTAIAVSIGLALGGYTKSFIESLNSDRDDTRQRLSSLEFILNSPNFERAMTSPPVAEEPK